jgi:hypothetical protein
VGSKTFKLRTEEYLDKGEGGMRAIKGIVSKDFEDDLGPCEILSGVINYSVCRTPTQMQKSEANITEFFLFRSHLRERFQKF